VGVEARALSWGLEQGRKAGRGGYESLRWRGWGKEGKIGHCHWMKKEKRGTEMEGFDGQTLFACWGRDLHYPRHSWHQ
jgi:hypothetical protein